MLNSQEIEQYFEQDFAIDVLQDYSLKFTRPDLLTHPNIPKPLHGLSPRTIKGKKWWDEKRREAYAKNNYHCFACGVYALYDIQRQRFEDLKLHAHESYKYDYENCCLELEEIVALCPTCHNYIHSGRMNALYDKGVMDEEDCWVVVEHAKQVLKTNNIDIENKEGYTIEDWDKWHIIIDGEKHFSKFKNYEEWEEHYGISVSN